MHECSLIASFMIVNATVKNFVTIKIVIIDETIGPAIVEPNADRRHS